MLGFAVLGCRVLGVMGFGFLRLGARRIFFRTGFGNCIISIFVLLPPDVAALVCSCLGLECQV